MRAKGSTGFMTPAAKNVHGPRRQADRFGRLGEPGICQRRQLGSRSAIYEDLRLERLPSPFKFGRRCYWRERDIDDHLEELIRNTRDE